jgi:putative glutamine amidotransferase
LYYKLALTFFRYKTVMKQMNTLPLIGITIDGHDPSTSDDFAKQYSAYYWYAMRSACIDSIIAAGGIPILLPHDTNLIPHYAELLDGLLISGGGHDTPPKYFGEDEVHPKSRIKEKRSHFEKEMFYAFYNKKKPILGICGGMQLIAALCGGKLYQYLPEDSNFHEHNQDIPFEQSFHEIICVPDSQLHNIFKKTERPVGVNSVHQQGIKDGGCLTPCAYAEDGLIEALEDKNHPFCIGVQWHPEYHVSEYDRYLFEAFIVEAKG